LGDLAQPVNLYAVYFRDSTRDTLENRGELKNVIWALRKQHRSACSGYGFVIDISPRLVAVPAAWNLPSPIETPDYTVCLQRSFTASPDDARGRSILRGILTEAIKKHFKEEVSADLGCLWHGACQ
jgi:hypothetical protein